MKSTKIQIAFFMILVITNWNIAYSCSSTTDIVDECHVDSQSDSGIADYIENEFVIADDSPFNVTGVRVYNYYPLHLDNNLFCKTESYSEACIDSDFASVFGFNEPVRVWWADYLVSSFNIVNDSVTYDIVQNYMYFRFVSNPQIEFYMFPYLLVSSIEICNSTTWMSASDLWLERTREINKSDNLVKDCFGFQYTLSEYWMRPGNKKLSVFTSVEDINPSIYELYDIAETLPLYIFDDLTASYGSVTGLYEEDPHYNWDIGIGDFPAFIAYYPNLAYHDLAFVSLNDNPHVSTNYYYNNSAYPGFGHMTIPTSLLWHNDVLLRYASNHIDTLANEITDAFYFLDNLISELGTDYSSDIVESSLSILATDFKSLLTRIQLDIFDLQDLIIHCDSLLTHFNSSQQFIPFENTFKDYTENIQRHTDLTNQRMERLKSDYDSTFSILSQINSDILAQEAFDQNFNQFQDSFDLSQYALDQSLQQFQDTIRWTLVGLIVTIGVFIASNVHKWRQDRRINRRDSESNILNMADILYKSFNTSELKDILSSKSLSTTGLKGALAIRIVKELGVEFTMEYIMDAP